MWDKGRSLISCYFLWAFFFCPFFHWVVNLKVIAEILGQERMNFRGYLVFLEKKMNWENLTSMWNSLVWTIISVSNTIMFSLWIFEKKKKWPSDGLGSISPSGESLCYCLWQFVQIGFFVVLMLFLRTWFQFYFDLIDYLICWPLTVNNLHLFTDTLSVHSCIKSFALFKRIPINEVRLCNIIIVTMFSIVLVV